MTTTSKRKVALLTGASRGIGKSTAIKLAEAGYDIAFCYHSNKDAAMDVAATIEGIGREVFFEKCDIASCEETTTFLAKAFEALGTPDAVINNAGIVSDANLVLMSEDSWQSVIQTNLCSVYNICRSVIFEFMKRKFGSIVNISSVAGVYGNNSQTNYSAAKAGIIGFSKALAKEVGPYQVRVNVVAPGLIKTDMVSNMPEDNIKNYINKIPLRRLGEAREVADLVEFLVSDKALYITGQVFQIDGGIIM